MFESVILIIEITTNLKLTTVSLISFDTRLFQNENTHGNVSKQVRQSNVVCLLVKFQFHTNGHGSLLAIIFFFSATTTLHNILN